MRPIDADELMIRIRDKASPIDIISKGYMGVSVLSVGEIGRTVDGMPSLDGAPVRKWIPCNERLPEDRKSVLAVIHICDNERDYITINRIVDDGTWFLYPESITHWMPLPEPPKMDGNSEY